MLFDRRCAHGEGIGVRDRAICSDLQRFAAIHFGQNYLFLFGLHAEPSCEIGLIWHGWCGKEKRWSMKMRNHRTHEKSQQGLQRPALMG